MCLMKVIRRFLKCLRVKINKYLLSMVIKSPLSAYLADFRPVLDNIHPRPAPPLALSILNQFSLER